ncbi:MAG: hypothetical protein RIT45_845 [Pseudomonadota bacterium]|jgi:hypothetical protein
MRRRWLTLSVLGMLIAATGAGCDRPCKRLADRLCERSGDDALCEQWKVRTSRVPDSTCEAGLRTLDKEAFR